MAVDKPQSKEVDLERTDRLPILTGITIDDDVEDDATRLEQTQSSTAVLPSGSELRVSSTGLDLPSLAESVRSVEERIARQNAEYDTLNRLYERTRDSQVVAGARAEELTAQLGAAQSALAVEQHRLNEMQRVLTETNAASEQTRTRVEEALRDAERAQTEARTLRDALAARDNTIAQTLHSLGERDAQLSALQREHAKIVPALESRSQASVRLESELKSARERADALALELKTNRQTVSDLTTRLARGESEINTNRRDIGAARAQAQSYLETLRSRAWRGEFNRNLFLEWDETMEASRSGQHALQAERDRLGEQARAAHAQLTELNETIAKLTEAKAGDAAALKQRAQELEAAQRAHVELGGRIGTLESEQKRLQGELLEREAAIARSEAQGSAEVQRVRDLLAVAEGRHAELQQKLQGLETSGKTQEEEMAVLMAHLSEARRPVQSFQSDIKRLSDEVAAKSANVDQLNEENRSLRASLERTRGALEERELLIRRLERSASNNANVLGRLQTSIERLGATPGGVIGATPSADFTAELVRIDGEHQMTFPLGRRTRIGRAPGCELQIDSQSVSRNHAMILKGARELIVEDLNSTNGVVVNGRKISRNILNDGDLLAIGEIQFRCVLRPNPRSAEVTEGATQAVSSGASGIRAAPEAANVDAAKAEATSEDAAKVDQASGEAATTDPSAVGEPGIHGGGGPTGPAGAPGKGF